MKLTCMMNNLSTFFVTVLLPLSCFSCGYFNSSSEADISMVLAGSRSNDTVLGSSPQSNVYDEFYDENYNDLPERIKDYINNAVREEYKRHLEEIEDRQGREILTIQMKNGKCEDESAEKGSHGFYDPRINDCRDCGNGCPPLTKDYLCIIQCEAFKMEATWHTSLKNLKNEQDEKILELQNGQDEKILELQKEQDEKILELQKQIDNFKSWKIVFFLVLLVTSFGVCGGVAYFVKPLKRKVKGLESKLGHVRPEGEREDENHPMN